MQTARENLSLEVAVLASLLLHAASIVCYEQRGTLARFSLFKPVAKVLSAAFAPPRYVRAEPSPQTITFVEAARREPPQPAPEREPPRQFMETDNSQVTGQQPKDAQYYSDRSTVVANPENPTGKTGDTPYLDGKETRPVMSTENVSLQPATPAMPATPSTPPVPPPPPPAPPTPPPVAVAEQPKEAADKGLNAAEEKQLAMVSREVATVPQAMQTEPSPPVPPPEARPPSPGSAARESRREIGAVKSHLTASGADSFGVAAFNVAESPFGVYDKQITKAVQSRWHALIAQFGIYERTGEVTVTFDLYSDGTIGPLKHARNTAGELLALFCEKAISESAPFERLPDRLQVLVGERPREVNFTFYY